MKKVYLSIALISLSITSFAQTRSPYIQIVDEFVPAPGQFTNELPEMTEEDTPETAAKKCTELIANNKQGMVSLGGFGGYITFHFDHPVTNVQNSNDFKIIGNASKNNNEPGIVMVSQDINGNGRPDDKWYELSGSADADCPQKVIYNYEITYTPNIYTINEKPKEIHWTDNQGNSGVIPRIDAYHKQEYYPLWIKEKLTFKGTLLPHNSTKNPVSHWYVQTGLRWGYADNMSDESNGEMDIANAVDENRQKVNLPYIDFVRVYTAINHVIPAQVGDMSTEIVNAIDLNPNASSIDAVMRENAGHQMIGVYSTDGQQLCRPQKGLNIIKYNDGTTQKIIIQ